MTRKENKEESLRNSERGLEEAVIDRLTKEREALKDESTKKYGEAQGLDAIIKGLKYDGRMGIYQRVIGYATDTFSFLKSFFYRDKDEDNDNKKLRKYVDPQNSERYAEHDFLTDSEIRKIVSNNLMREHEENVKRDNEVLEKYSKKAGS